VLVSAQAHCHACSVGCEVFAPPGGSTALFAPTHTP
jgi:hypothetical protein